jgi:soluble lytic murein transglycosylase-like protein
MTDQPNTSPKAPRRRKTAAEGETITPTTPKTTTRKTAPPVEAAPNPFNPHPTRSAAPKAPSKPATVKEKAPEKSAAPAKSVAPKTTTSRAKAKQAAPPASIVQVFLHTLGSLLGRMFLWLVRIFWRLNWRFKLVSIILIAALAGGLYTWLFRTVGNITSANTIASFFPPSVRYWSSSIARWSAQYDVDPNLIATIMQIESCGWTTAESYAAAQGLFQVMPMHFTEEEKVNMTDPETNAKRGMGVIKDCLERADNNIGLALACYNGGPRLIFLDQSAWPEQSQRYYYWGTGIYGDAKAGRSQSPRLNEWLSAGGQSLCQRAESGLSLPISTDIPYVPANIVTEPTAVLPTHSAEVAPIATIIPSDMLPTFPANR